MRVPATVAATIFWWLQIVLFPPALVGYVLFVVRSVAYSCRTGASATLLTSFYTRWMQHRLGTRRDEPCARLMRVLPNVSQPGLRLVTGPTLLAHRLTGYVQRRYRYPYEGAPPMRDQPAARTTFFDAALERHLAGVRQLVVLGAGLDTRAYRLPAGTRVRCFEVDTPRMQAFKREMLRRAGVDTRRVTYVPADFRQDDWLERLAGAGFEPDEPGLFLWEAVTMYLEREAVVGTLREIAGTAGGGAVAFDYFSAELLEDRSPFMGYARAVIGLTGEPFRFGIDTTPPARQRVAAFLESYGLSLEEQRGFGEETDRTPAKGGFVTATVSGGTARDRAAERPALVDEEQAA
jgi:methyltransferase (TIGR00027 family)